MAEFLNLNGERLSENVSKVSPIKYESLKIENTTLDGSVHTQIIGKAQRLISFEILCTLGQADLIGNGEATGEKFKLVRGDWYYIGWLKASPSWSRINHEYFVATIELKISEDGSA